MQLKNKRNEQAHQIRNKIIDTENEQVDARKWGKERSERDKES